jgi:hypothetical protein
MSSYAWQRIAVRASQLLWRQKGTVLFGAIVLGALGAYALFVQPAPGADLAASNGDGNDCADTVMAAVAGTPGVQQQAYQCMDATFQQRVSQQQFSTQLQSSGSGRGPVTKIERVASYDAPTGATLVYYAVDMSAQQSLGFVVYLGANGKVLNIE